MTAKSCEFSPHSATVEEQLDTILNCVADGVFTVDRDKRITFFNRAAERITGFSREEALGELCGDIFRTPFCDGSCTLDQVGRTKQNVMNRPVRIMDRDGRMMLVSVSAAPLKNSTGEVIGGVETFRDLSTEDELRRQIHKSYTFHDIVSRHPKMHDLFAILPDIAESSVSVLIEGESGTGKELFARAIHNLSTRQDEAFIAVNLGSLPDSLLESELFGYRRGAFTDAKQDKPGRFDLASRGTLFLDEIGEISPAIQVRLLRVLQEKTFEPLGGTEPVHTDARIIAATNASLKDMVKEGSFREDLYYRLNVLRIELPPLRDRRCDISILIDHMRQQLNAETGKAIENVSDRVLELLIGYDFPGNIRELHNVMQHAFVLCKEPVIQLHHLPGELVDALDHDASHKALSLESLEKSAIREALLDNGNNKTRTARQLGINASTLYRKMKRYNISHT